jgi:hypothetical protein
MLLGAFAAAPGVACSAADMPAPPPRSPDPTADWPADAADAALRAFAGGLAPAAGEPAFEAAPPDSGAVRAALLRIVFLVFAEARGLLVETASGGESLAEMLDRLTAAAARDPAAHAERFDAWAALEARFARAARFSSASGGGGLFDRGPAGTLSGGRALLVSDAGVEGALRALFFVDGRRVDDRAFEVEHLGSFHEVLMDFELGHAESQTEKSSRGRVGLAGALALRAVGARRQSGAHYTPRSLTEPIVQRTLAPLLDRLQTRAAEAGHAAPTPEALLALKVVDPAMGSGAFLVEVCRQLGEAVVAAWRVHGSPPDVPPGAALPSHARRLVAQRCLYGVDANPLAVALARLSLFLVAGAADTPLDFVDHGLRCGDSLLGLTTAQIVRFTWDAAAPGPPGPSGLETPPADALRRRGDACLAAFFAESTLGGRERRRKALCALSDAETGALFPAERDAARAAVDAARLSLTAPADRPARRPFHWMVEFPEVFARDEAGFDAVVGNPPFLGGRNLSAAHGSDYNDWLCRLHPESSGNADLVAHFFRRSFDLLRSGGTLGLVATNTLAQGDTRRTGLRWICTHGGTIYAARRRVRWPGLAAVVVSVVWLARGEVPGPRLLDDREVEHITAYLFHAGGHGDPASLPENAGRCFQGCIVLGVGFTFDDAQAEATPLAEMRRLIAQDARNAECIFPFLGGEEVTTSPTHAHHRYVIDFGERSEGEARAWPALMAIVEQKVRPGRLTKDAKKYPRMVHQWWKFWNARPDLRQALVGCDTVLVTPLISTHCVFARVDARRVHSHKLGVFPDARPALFAVLSSRVHEIWARFQSSTLGDALNYSPTDCFETFPFPDGWATNARLDAAGRAYDTFRAALMVRHGQGLTATYNRFHDPGEAEPAVLELRSLHAMLDRAVLDAYGFEGLPVEYAFAPALQDPAPGVRSRAWRLRFTDATHDEVLARLLALNAARA